LTALLKILNKKQKTDNYVSCFPEGMK
jgi:hypothetical protein